MHSIAPQPAGGSPPLPTAIAPAAPSAGGVEFDNAAGVVPAILYLRRETHARCLSKGKDDFSRAAFVAGVGIDFFSDLEANARVLWEAGHKLGLGEMFRQMRAAQVRENGGLL
jgi:hypothetical protein